MSLFDIEVGNWGSIVLLLALAGFVLLWLGGATTPGLLVGGALLALIAAVLYYAGVRIDYRLKHGWSGR